jgi:hypothetical protein
MEIDMDLMIMFKHHKKHHKLLSEVHEVHTHEDDALHLEDDNDQHNYGLI